jgi:hypothetical protein
MSEGVAPVLHEVNERPPWISQLSDDVTDITLSYLNIWDKRCVSLEYFLTTQHSFSARKADSEALILPPICTCSCQKQTNNCT